MTVSLDVAKVLFAAGFSTEIVQIASATPRLKRRTVAVPVVLPGM